MRPRDLFEASCHAAVSKYKDAVAAGTYMPVADNTLVDALLKAWERTITHAIRTTPCKECQRRQAAMQPIMQALTEVKRHHRAPRSPEEAAAHIRATS